MDLSKVLQQLHEELANLNAAILSLERLQEAGKHRGKESTWLEEMEKPARKARKRKGDDEATMEMPKDE